MKKILFKTAATLFLVFGMSFFSTTKAQNNKIEEVKLNANDGFSELRNLVINNFDFTTPNLSEGLVSSQIAFNVSENGKITNVHANGDCKYVSAELENVMNQLLYKIDVNKLNRNMIAATYVMPVQVRVEN